MQGIYSITCIPTGKCYIGSSVNIHRRWQRHKQMLWKGNHFNNHLLNAWERYGEEAFTFEILEVVSDNNQLIEREKFWITAKNSVANGFNKNANPADPPLKGKKHSPETLVKLSITSSRPYSPERLQRCRERMAKLRGVIKRPGNGDAAKRNALVNNGMLVAYDDNGVIHMTFTSANEAKKSGYGGVGVAIRNNHRRGGFKWKFVKQTTQLI